MSAVVLITGGARSGKSLAAEDRTMSWPAPWAYIATAEAHDEEMAARIAAHRARRDDGWRTVEHPTDLVGTLRATEAGHGARLVDCLTLWLSNLMALEADIAAQTEALCAYLADCPVPTVIVTNEVGLGIVPTNALARRFRDEAGRLNQRVAAVADEVTLTVAGLPVPVKRP